MNCKIELVTDRRACHKLGEGNEKQKKKMDLDFLDRIRETKYAIEQINRQCKITDVQQHTNQPAENIGLHQKFSASMK